MSPDPTPRPTLSRRSFGAVAAVAAASTALVGCATDEPLDLPGLPPLGDVEPDLEQVRAGLAAERQLLEHLSAVRQRHRRVRRALAPTASVHEAHVDLLGRAVEEAADGPSDTPATDPRRVAGDPAQALGQLIRLERSLAEDHVGAAMASRSGPLARVLASMSAAAAQQAVLLAALPADSAAEPPAPGS